MRLADMPAIHRGKKSGSAGGRAAKWQGEERYVAVVYEFKPVEPIFRKGFEAALHPGTRGKTYSDVEEQLREDYPDAYDDDAFRRGFERGRMYFWVFKDEPEE